ncbi:ankyrin repeat domain-containing protein [bacterium]|nr:ankyrin repeat domain-containing protein [bacterium]
MRANNYSCIYPLIDLCKNGQLFEVIDWINSGKPINLPEQPRNKTRRKSPLEYAIIRGFYSLVQVLLENGALIYDGTFNALRIAVEQKRPDLVKMIVKHGAEIDSVEIDSVFQSWNPELISFFIDQGAEVESNNALAKALCDRVRITIGIYKKYRKKFASFDEQLNIALRYHCAEGDMKWISLLLWAGADPYKKGMPNPYEKHHPDLMTTALEEAAWKGYLKVFEMKQITLSADMPIAYDILQDSCYSKTTEVLTYLLDIGLKPAEAVNCGSDLIKVCILSMTWAAPDYHSLRIRNNKDNYVARRKLDMLKLLMQNGAKWVPEDRYEINSVRRSLLKMHPDYTVKFVQLLGKYKATDSANVEHLLGTPAVKRLLIKHEKELSKALKKIN